MPHLPAVCRSPCDRAARPAPILRIDGEQRHGAGDVRGELGERRILRDDGHTPAGGTRPGGDRPRRAVAAVAVVSHAFAERYLAGRDPVGVRLVLPGPPNTTGIPTLVVGVVSDGKHRTIGEPQKAALYSPYAQNMGRGGAMTQFLVRTSTDPSAAVRRRQRRACPRPIRRWPWTCRRWSRRWRSHFCQAASARCCLGCPVRSGLLAGAGRLYAAVAFAVSRRTAEIGIRRALGATGGAVIRLVLGDWAWLVRDGDCRGAGRRVVHHAAAGAVSRRRTERHRPGQLRRDAGSARRAERRRHAGPRDGGVTGRSRAACCGMSDFA